jgi:DNA polymerase III alpha subunit (gram-positive type)
MIACALDFETTGTDRQKDRVIELGVSLYSTGQKRFLDSVGQLVQTDVAISSKISDITGIYPNAVSKFGYEEANAFETLATFLTASDFVIGHNIRSFDWPIAQAWAKRRGISLPDILVVDTFEDIPGVPPEALITMCAKAGFLLADAHSALADAQASLKLAVHYGIDAVVERAKIPTVVVQSLAPRTATNSENKEAKFRWKPAPYNIWWKAVKETDVEELAKSLPFRITVLDKSVSLEDLRN